VSRPGPGVAGPRVVAIGGGHGLAATIRATRRYAGRVTAVVATADDGGSTGRLRTGMPALPAPGDVRRCLEAMAEGSGSAEVPLAAALDFRFGGTDVEGHALGNLLLAGLSSVSGDFASAVEQLGQLLGLDPAVAQVVPATASPVRLFGRTAAGEAVVGEVAVSGTEGLDRVWVVPCDPGEGGECPAAPKAAIDALAEADQVVLGPGSLYSSVLSAVAVNDVRDGVAGRKGRLVYVCNLRAEVAETRGYDVAGHVAALTRHGVTPDVVVVQPGAFPRGDLAAAVRLVEADVARPHGLAHDPAKLGVVLASLVA
jgi:uncharacterized cofD-like protein